MKPKTTILIITVIGIVSLIFYFESQKPAKTSGGDGKNAEIQVTAMPGRDISAKESKYERAKEIMAPTGFVNTPSTSSGQASPLKIADLVGKKVILVDFWTYSCINCQRTIPYLNAWYEKYKDKGLEIVGVHTPEFEFEKKLDNVKAAVEKFNIKYPVVLDSNHGTWDAYGNLYWPREYLIDIDGFIVHDTIGEGGYDETEKKIQELLTERMSALGEKGTIEWPMATPKGAIDFDPKQVSSPETYFGASRNEYLANGQIGKTGVQTFSRPAIVEKNKLYLVGDWDFKNEFTQNKTADARIIFKYRAKNVYFVASSEAGVKIRVLRDGKPVAAEAGEDVRSGSAIIKEERLYKLISDPAGYGEHTLEIIIEGTGLNGFTFTFG